MVMSGEVVEGARVSNQEKELASEAVAQFGRGEFGACVSTLEKLEVMRPTDVKVAHNKIVAQCRADQGPVPLSDVVQQLEGLAKTAGVSFNGTKREEDSEWVVLIYNLAVAKFQQRHILQASQLGSQLLPLPTNISSSLARKILFLNAELSLALRQPQLAQTQVAQLESYLEGNNNDSRLMILKARCQVMARQIKSLKKELKSVNLPGFLGVTCEFVRSHIELQCGNHRKSIKMLNSAVQVGGNKVFPHYYNNLGCLHQSMKKPNLAVYYFKNALERLETSGGAVLAVPSQSAESGKENNTSWITQSQIMYNISISLLHAKRPQLAFDLLLEVVGSHYLDPSVWFHLAECCIQFRNPEEGSEGQGQQLFSSGTDGSVGLGFHHKIVASNPSNGDTSTTGAQARSSMPKMTLDFAYICLKNAESLLPQDESVSEYNSYCEGVGYIGNPLSWTEVEQLRVSVLMAKAYVALAVGDFISAGEYAATLLQMKDVNENCKILAHLYAAESLILQDKLSEAIKHLDPENVAGVQFPASDAEAGTVCWLGAGVWEGRAAVQYNLAVAFSLREEWEKAGNLLGQLNERGRGMNVHVLLLSLYVNLRQGHVDQARQLVRERCPFGRKDDYQ